MGDIAMIVIPDPNPRSAHLKVVSPLHSVSKASLSRGAPQYFFGFQPISDLYLEDGLSFSYMMSFHEAYARGIHQTQTALQVVPRREEHGWRFYLSLFETTAKIDNSNTYLFGQPEKEMMLDIRKDNSKVRLLISENGAAPRDFTEQENGLLYWIYHAAPKDLLEFLWDKPDYEIKDWDDFVNFLWWRQQGGEHHET